MFTGITRPGSALIASLALLTGGAVVRVGAAAADPSQDEQFSALLTAEGIPALEGMPTLISTAHKVCRVLDKGISVDTMVDAMLNNAYTQDPVERLYPRTRLTRTMTRFITASVEAYCPRDEGKIASIMGRPRGAGWHKPAGGGVLSLPELKQSGAHGAALASTGRVLPSGDMTQPSPPDIPPPPPVDHLRTPPRANAAPPAPKRLPRVPERPPAPKQQPPPPPQVKPPAAPPQPGGPATGGGAVGGGAPAGGGGSGGGSTGGGGPVAPAPAPAPPPPPAPPMGPGFVRLAP